MKKHTRDWWLSLPSELVGKETEKLVTDQLKLWSERQGFFWHRMPDARAARGALKKQPADILVANQEQVCFLEIKALRHPRLLPRDNISQLATLKKFEETAMRNYVMVFQYLEGVWRIESVEHIAFGVPSWDVTKWLAYPSVEAALTAVELNP